MKRLLCRTLLAGALLTTACQSPDRADQLLAEPLRNRILADAERDLTAEPVTVTAFIAERSAGTSHDFYSEGDYWWPDPQHPDGPYIRRDGETNPDNFVAHRHAMIRFSRIVGNLTSAWLLTGDPRYVGPVLKHVQAWFADPQTRMNPHLLYAQAIQGVVTGRGVGIIDTIHLIEVVQSLLRLEARGMVPAELLAATKAWFADYLRWLTTHPYGIDEMQATNNHATCWFVQAAIFAKYVGDEAMLAQCAERFRTVLLPEQLAADGSFPRELGRTKPYGYSIFNLDAMATLCQIFAGSADDLWHYTLPDGRNMRLAVEFLYPYLVDKTAWPYGSDVMYWEEWPVAQPAMLFAWRQFGDAKYYDAWAAGDHFPENEEVIRNLPVRNPVIWLYGN